MSIDLVKTLDFFGFGDERGSLVALEEKKDIPFKIKRVFYIYDTLNNVVRGNHANKKSEFVLASVAGSCKIKVKDGLGNEKIFFLNDPTRALYIPKLLWKEMYDFSFNAVLLVFSNEFYDPNEYIRDWAEYARFAKNIRGGGI